MSQVSPTPDKAGAISFVTSVNIALPILLSFRKMKELTALGYCPGITLPPINKSRSPSLS